MVVTRRELLHLHKAKASISWSARGACVAPQHQRLAPGRHSTSPAPPFVDPAQDEQVIRQPVQVLERLGIDRLGFDERSDEPLGPARHRPRQMQEPPRAACRPAGRRNRAARARRSCASISCSSRSTCAGTMRNALAPRAPSSGVQRSAPRSNRSFWMRASMLARRPRHGAAPGRSPHWPRRPCRRPRPAGIAS